MNAPAQIPARLASEDVIISAPMSYTGSARRIIRLRRRAPEGWPLVPVTTGLVLLIAVVWVLVTVWYLMWGVLLVPYRLARRGTRKRKVEALRHRELLAALEGSAHTPRPAAPQIHPPEELVGDADRESAIEELRSHCLAGRLTQDEFEHRVELAHRARSRRDLAAATVNLPQGTH